MTAMTSVAATDTKKQPLGAQANIPPRRMDFEFSQEASSRYYYKNDPFLSAFMTTLSSLFPEGESFFVEAVRHYRNQITDPLLKAQVSGFIGQEAMHSKEHDAFNKAAEATGYPVARMDRDVGKLLHLVQLFAPKKFQLAATVCLEHYTAIMAEMLLTNTEVQANFSPEMRQLWLWHALEENEHKTVAWDVYEKVGGGYALRAGTMIPTTIIFFAVVAAFQARMLASDGQLFKGRQTLSALNHMFGRKGVFTAIIPKYFDFFKPSFHPKHHDTDALLEVWREKLFGKDGLLIGQIKNPQVLKKH
jgi:predicted metal-dependent hydrolase